MKLSIIIPAHNEEKRIGKMLEEYLPYFAERYGENVEFVVVVNGSDDNTEQVVRQFMDEHPSIRCLVDEKKIGKGGALMEGFAVAKGELIGFTDADGATPPSAFQDLVDRIKDADVIIASRWCKGAQVSPQQPLRRRVASRTFNLFTRFLFGLRLTDTQCGAKLMRRDPLLSVMPHLGITRWAFDVDMLYQLKRVGARIKEIPTVWHDVEGSKLHVFATSVEMFMALVRLRLIYSPFRWAVRLYRPNLFPFIRRFSDLD